MHARLNTNQALTSLHHLRGQVRRASSGVPAFQQESNTISSQSFSSHSGVITICMCVCNPPCNVNELRSQSTHTLNTVQQILQTLLSPNQFLEAHTPSFEEKEAFTWAVRGGKYSKDHHTLSSLCARSIFWVIFMMVVKSKEGRAG